MKMISKKDRIGIIVLVCFIGVMFVIQALADQKYGVQKITEDSSGLWLSHIVGDEVIVTFISAPRDMGKTVKARLMDAEVPGIVLQFEKEEIFFSFSNIISVQLSK
ncbi:MAG: hypothetical protein HKM93_19650 [Desulfobacteraceae bacterium]|nr:hypothetical protein [Desulfobacteraceae bacterium]